MLTQALAIARNTFVESIRQPIYLVLVLAGLVLQAFNLLLSSYSMSYSDSSEVSKDDKLLLDMGLATVFVIATLLAALICTAVLSREIENKTALTVISKPVGRPLFVIGKYLGSTGAILLAAILQLIFLQFAVRHGVMSTAADKFDAVAFTFLAGAVLLGIGIAAWGNYFYGWIFSSASIIIMTPALVIGLLLTYPIARDWTVQPISTDFRPQVLLASLTLLLAVPVISAVALAASTRLGQVMTIAVCLGVFMLGLLSNYFFGRHAFVNSPIASVLEADPDADRDGDFSDGGDIWRIKLDGPTSVGLEPGDRIYYAPTPNGLGLVPPKQPPFTGDVNNPADFNRPGLPRNILVREVEPVVDDWHHLKLLNSGGTPTPHPPRPGDFLFVTETTINWPARAAWSVVPNLQYFWLVDAISQAHPIPPGYVLLVLIYTFGQVTGLVSLAVILFQRREVG